VAKAREIPGLSGDDSYGESAAKVVEVRTAELVESAFGVLDMGDIERLHRMRVASRRLRAALEVFEACFPGETHAATLAEVKTLADALGERRDRDVAIAALEDFARGLPAADRPGVASLVATLRAEQATANGKLAPFVSEERVAALDERLARLVSDARTGVEA
jgi:CHAD domain-containing protein